jgi:hypothetical protein
MARPVVTTFFYESSSDSDDEGLFAGPRVQRAALALALAVAAVLVLLLLYYVYAPRILARRLARCGWAVYLLRGCDYCRRQMCLLDGFDRYVVCADGAAVEGYAIPPPVSCGSIPSYPYWHNTQTGETRVGYQDRAALGHMAQGQ